MKKIVKSLIISNLLLLSAVPMAHAEKKVGGGVFFISQHDDGEFYALLAERKTGSGWVNFGGLRDPEDASIEEAAAREVFEESMGLINLNPCDLATMPYADLALTPQLQNQGNHKPSKSNYRMYFNIVNYFSEQQFYDRMTELNNSEVDRHLIEMSNFKWIRLNDIMKHLTREGPSPELFTVLDSQGQEQKIKLFEPLRKMLSQQKVIDYYGNLAKIPVVDKTPALDDAHLSFQGEAYHYTQTEAHLKLVLGEKYVDGDLKKNIDTFLKDYHDPFYAKEKKEFKEKIKHYEKKLKTLERDTAEYEQCRKKLNQAKDHYDNRNIDHQKHNENLKETLLLALESEQANNDKIVFYHGTENHINFLWDVLTEFRAELMGMYNPNMKILRSFDEFFKDIHNIHDFVRKIDEQELLNPYEQNKKRKEEVKYNYLPGYGAGGLSVNVSLFGNHKYKGSSSFAYLLRAHSERPAPSLKLLQQFFNMLGLDDEELGEDMLNRLQEYTKVFLQYFSSEDKIELMKKYSSNAAFLKSDDFAKVTYSNNGVMLQIFVNPDVVNQMAYVSELVGDRINFQLDQNQHATDKPTDVLGMMRENPEGFEEVLKKNHKIFQNQNNKLIQHVREDFNKDPNFIHANVLESRLLLLPEMMMDSSKVQINTFFLHQIDQEEYKESIRRLVQRDVQKVREINPNIEGYFIQADHLPGLEMSKNVTPIMIKAMIDSWGIGRLQSLGLINASFTVNIDLGNGLETKTFTPLSYALALNNSELALEIIEKGGAIETGMVLDNVLKAAINKDKVESFTTIIKSSPLLILKEIDGKPILTYAIEKRSEKLVEKILTLKSPMLNGCNPLLSALIQAVSKDATYKDYVIFQTVLKMAPQYLNFDLGMLDLVEEAMKKNKTNNRLIFIKKQLETEFEKKEKEFLKQMNRLLNHRARFLGRNNFLLVKPGYWEVNYNRFKEFNRIPVR